VVGDASCPDGVTASCDDSCPFAANPGQADTGGVQSPANPDAVVPDGRGDACQCGDVNGDGKVRGNDVVLIRRFLIGLPVPASFDARRCNVTGEAGNESSRCAISDATVIRRTLLGLAPGIQPGICQPVQP
jgi:hypothetical protein